MRKQQGLMLVCDNKCHTKTNKMTINSKCPHLNH